MAIHPFRDAPFSCPLNGIQGFFRLRTPFVPLRVSVGVRMTGWVGRPGLVGIDPVRPIPGLIGNSPIPDVSGLRGEAALALLLCSRLPSARSAIHPFASIRGPSRHAGIQPLLSKDASFSPDNNTRMPHPCVARVGFHNREVSCLTFPFPTAGPGARERPRMARSAAARMANPAVKPLSPSCFARAFPALAPQFTRLLLFEGPPGMPGFSPYFRKDASFSPDKDTRVPHPCVARVGFHNRRVSRLTFPFDTDDPGVREEPQMARSAAARMANPGSVFCADMRG
jgi:hypothetical protein